MMSDMQLIYLTFCVLFAAELFSDVQPLVQSALDGYNVSIFAYGQTHSGKTHTMVALSFFHSVFVCVCADHFPLKKKRKEKKRVGQGFQIQC